MLKHNEKLLNFLVFSFLREIEDGNNYSLEKTIGEFESGEYGTCQLKIVVVPDDDEFDEIIVGEDIFSD